MASLCPTATFTAVVAGWVLALSQAAVRERPPQFLIISSPEQRSVYYVAAPSFHRLSLSPNDRPEPPDAQVLIDGAASRCASECTAGSDEGLQSPQGLALHQGRGGATLYVSDVGAKNIYAYEIASAAPASSWATSAPSVGQQRKVRSGVDGARWLAVDSEGNLFYTIESGQVEMLSVASLNGAKSATAEPTVLYKASTVAAVSTPAGIAVDGAYIFWANQAGGVAAGTVIGAPASAPSSIQTAGTAVGAQVQAQAPRALAANGAGAYGVCTARNMVFYTGERLSLFAVKKTGGSIAEVSRGFEEPRGCAFDGEGTLYVADAKENAVFSLPAVSSLRSVRQISRVANVQGPSQVAVFTPSGAELRGPPLGSGAPRTRAEGLMRALLSVVVAAAVLASLAP
eukprot:TRINITY_DN39211_c0_g1_i1.p1 TRINITY_DN39211_c0_g1~~TRINITY_DN39211_c0_g1_i1.p1  ORF type:complete len:400 (-),score=73.67 TRINITY_DN39211_c0_g1_i1:74-1273(-)